MSSNTLLSHLNQVHSGDNFKIICGLSNAPECHKGLRSTAPSTNTCEENMMISTEDAPGHRKISTTLLCQLKMANLKMHADD